MVVGETVSKELVAPRIEETCRAFDRQTGHHPQAMSFRGIQQPPWRARVARVIRESGNASRAFLAVVRKIDRICRFSRCREVQRTGQFQMLTSQ
jgi:hypothetical protein